ncbi:carph-isopro domain-containing protein [Sphingomonas sp. Root50]|uniref:carph-isopro domain-containing protein n=1 Tax=unclassified Sphingomonas TaxID=196159 RepID=UPI0039E0ABF9
MSKAIIRQFGGIRPLARALQHRNPSTVLGWWKRNIIPARQQPNVLRLAQELGLDINAADLITAHTEARPKSTLIQSDITIRRKIGMSPSVNSASAPTSVASLAASSLSRK